MSVRENKVGRAYESAARVYTFLRRRCFSFSLSLRINRVELFNGSLIADESIDKVSAGTLKSRYITRVMRVVVYYIGPKVERDYVDRGYFRSAVYENKFRLKFLIDTVARRDDLAMGASFAGVAAQSG